MTLSGYLQALLINLFIVAGIWTLFRKEMIFGKVGDFLDAKLPVWISKPTYACPPCMASVWGTTFFFLSRLYELLPIWAWPLHCLCLCGLTTLVMFLDHE
jgi:hypothetical protein